MASYARWFGVDLMCAAKELQILGTRFSPEYLEALRRTVAARPRHRRDAANETIEAESMWNQELEFIAGYTEAGLPFGVTSDEMQDVEGDEVPASKDDFGKAVCDQARKKRR